MIWLWASSGNAVLARASRSAMQRPIERSNWRANTTVAKGSPARWHLTASTIKSSSWLNRMRPNSRARRSTSGSEARAVPSSWASEHPHLVAAILAFVPSSTSARRSQPLFAFDTPHWVPANDTGLTLSILRKLFPLMLFHCGALEHFDTSHVNIGACVENACPAEETMAMKTHRNLKRGADRKSVTAFRLGTLPLPGDALAPTSSISTY